MSRVSSFAVGAVVLLGLLFWVRTPLVQAQSQDEKPPAGAREPDMGAVLMEGLRETEGCLGVDAGRMQSGKNVIFAWFADKEAVLRWYLNPTHRRFMSMLGDRATGGDKPLAHVPDKTPLLVVASITFTGKPEIDGVPMPISSIAIEIFTAAPGGAFINERFSPKSFPIPQGMHDYTEAMKKPKP